MPAPFFPLGEPTVNDRPQLQLTDNHQQLLDYALAMQRMYEDEPTPSGGWQRLRRWGRHQLIGLAGRRPPSSV
jgi:hypothetical protein